MKKSTIAFNSVLQSLKLPLKKASKCVAVYDKKLVGCDAIVVSIA